MTMSEQPRFQGNDDALDFLGRYLFQIKSSAYELPMYKADTRERDRALIRFAYSEPLLAGVLSSVVSRDSNRQWSLIGPARSVAVWARKLHDADEGLGWRSFVAKNSSAYYNTNIGMVAEIGSDRNGVPQKLWSFDPTNVRLSGKINPEQPFMYYYPSTGKIDLYRKDVLHQNSMPNIQEKMASAGFCAVERSTLMAKIMLGLIYHQLEKLDFAPQRGLAIFKGFMRDEWEQAKAEAEAQMKNRDASYYRGILSIFTNNSDAAVDLLGFSNLPDNFQMMDFIEIIMQAYSLAFSYPVGEFWAIQSGSFGRTGEHQLQQQQATAKGELEFAKGLEEQLQSWFLPPSVDFSFEQRNDTGEFNKLQMIQAKSTMLLDMFAASRQGEEEGQASENLFSKDEIRQLYVESGIIPPEWTSQEAEEVDYDLSQMRDRIYSNPHLMKRIVQTPNEPLVCYRWGPKNDYLGTRNRATNMEVAKYLSNLTFPHGDIEVLANYGGELLEKRTYAIAK